MKTKVRKPPAPPLALSAEDLRWLLMVLIPMHNVAAKLDLTGAANYLLTACITPITVAIARQKRDAGKVKGAGENPKEADHAAR